MGTAQVIISALTFIVALSVAVYGVYQYQDSNRPDLVIHPVDSKRTNSQGDGTYSSPPETAVIFVLTNIGKNQHLMLMCSSLQNGLLKTTGQRRTKGRMTACGGRGLVCTY